MRVNRDAVQMGLKKSQKISPYVRSLWYGYLKMAMNGVCSHVAEFTHMWFYCRSKAAYRQNPMDLMYVCSMLGLYYRPSAFALLSYISFHIIQGSVAIRVHQNLSSLPCVEAGRSQSNKPFYMDQRFKRHEGTNPRYMLSLLHRRRN